VILVECFIANIILFDINVKCITCKSHVNFIFWIKAKFEIFYNTESESLQKGSLLSF